MLSLLAVEEREDTDIISLLEAAGEDTPIPSQEYNLKKGKNTR